MQQERKAIEKAKHELQFIGVERPKSHIVFVDSVDEAKKFDVAEYFDTVPELVGRFHNRPRKSQLAEPVFAEKEEEAEGGDDNDFEDAEPSAPKNKRHAKYKELEGRVKRMAVLDEMLEKVELKKKLMAPGEKKLVRDKRTGKSHYVWASERKKWYAAFVICLFVLEASLNVPRQEEIVQSRNDLLAEARLVGSGQHNIGEQKCVWHAAEDAKTLAEE